MEYLPETKERFIVLHAASVQEKERKKKTAADFISSVVAADQNFASVMLFDNKTEVGLLVCWSTFPITHTRGN